MPSAFVGMCLLEAAILLGIVVHYKWSGRIADLAWVGRDGAVVLAVLALAATGGVLIGRGWNRPSTRRATKLTIAMNMVAVLLLVGIAEVMLRVVILLRPAVISDLPRGLLPRDWPQVAAANLAHLRSVTGDGSYMRADPELGWTIGESRRSYDGLYFSSAEGIRSPAPGISYSAVTGKRRIALVGDSYAFSEEGPFEDSLGYHLQRTLGEDFQVLNFGVPGYGVDQSYLRYQKDGIQWKPEVTILQFVLHDLYRTLTVHTPIAFPEWKMPYAKPRFILTDGKLLLRNVPVPAPEVLLAETDISKLPFIELEAGLLESDWRWHWYDNLISIRFALSLIPNWPVREEQMRGSLVDINAAILRQFVDSARASGTTPLVAYFPTRGSGEVSRPLGSDSIADDARAVIERAGIEYFNGTDCLRGVNPESLYMPRGHYGGAGNSALAGCLVGYASEKGLLRNNAKRSTGIGHR
jgi:hypothetical protein